MPFKIYKQKATREYWENLWNKSSIENEYGKTEGHYLSNIFLKYLPQEGNILEAGCGIGQWVHFLAENNYNVEGIDIADSTIMRVKRKFPQLALRRGDVLKIDRESGYYSGYISLGVVEHFEEGPDKALREAYRVLTDNGIMIITVPHNNYILKFQNIIKARNKGVFYQYAYSKAEFRSILVNNGFKILYSTFWDVPTGVKHDLLQDRYFTVHNNNKKKTGTHTKSVKWLIERYPLNVLFGHTLIFVCKKIAI